MKSFGLFVRFLMQKEQKRELSVMAMGVLLLGVVLYICYPYPFVYPDSATYVFTAKEGVFDVYRPMGYPRYLQLLHSMNGGLSFVFVASYMLNGLAALFFLYTYKYLFAPRNRVVFYAVSFFALTAPTVIFATNYLMSDGLFNTLTMLFLTTALWIVYRRNIPMCIIHLLVFVLLYRVRYAGMFYVPLSVFAFYLSTKESRFYLRILSCCLPVVVFLLVYFVSKGEYKKETGTDVSSGFSGWQLMNNASVLIPRAKQLDATAFDTEKLKSLHSFFATCPDSIFTVGHMLSTNLMWDNAMPLKYYTHYLMQSTGQPYYKCWIDVSMVYADYAKTIIGHYPGSFFTKFVVPSFCSFFIYKPITEDATPFIIEPYYKEYYGVEGDSYTYTCNFFQRIAPVRNVMNYIYWATILIAVVGFCVKTNRSSVSGKPWQLSFLLLLFLILYIGASSIASPNTTWRYAMPIYIPSLLFVGIVAQQYLRNEKAGKTE